MAEEITYKSLRDMVREEKSQPNLSALPGNFYEAIGSFLEKKQREIEERRQVLHIKEFENAVAVIKELVAIRQQKILFRSIRSGGEHREKETEHMTQDEHELYDRFCAVLQDEKSRLEGIFTRYRKGLGPEKKADSSATREDAPKDGKGSLKKVRFVKEVPAYVGMNKKTIGPFKEGDESFLPDKEAELLHKEKIAEYID